MPDSVSSTVGLCHSRIIALLKFGALKRLAWHDRDFIKPIGRAVGLPFDMFIRHDNFKSHFLM